MKVCSFILILVLAHLLVESEGYFPGCNCNFFCFNCEYPIGVDPPCIIPCSNAPADQAAIEKSVEKCCNKKEVGGVSYTLVPGLPDPETHPRHCIDGCVYTQDGTTTQFCFAKGNLKVECGDQSPGSNETTMPGSNGNCTAILTGTTCSFSTNTCKSPFKAFANPQSVPPCSPCTCLEA